MLPSDLEICRACALLVFFLERSVEAYKTVFLLYTHPDQEYHLDNSPIGNDVRFEVIQILKKGLFFDPEFWSLLNIKTNCLKLMSDQVAKAALCEIMEEDKWVPNYCARGHCKCHAEQERTVVKPMVNPASPNKQESGTVEKEPSSPSADASPEVLPSKRRGRKPGSHIAKDLEMGPPRRSFRQLDLAQNHSRQLNDRRQRFLTRQAEKKTLKRRGRKPRWLLEELASQAENSVPRQGKKPGRKPKQLNVLKDISVDTPVIEITSEFSYPDNEVNVPTDARSQPISIMTSTTEPRFDDSASEESPPSWREKMKATEDLVMRPQDYAIYMRKFHTYAKVPEEGENTVDDKVLTTTHDVEQKRQVPAPVKNDPSEPVRAITMAGTETTSVTPTVTRDGSVPLGGTVDANAVPHPVLKLSSVTPVNAVGQDTVVNTLRTVDPPRDEATIFMADTTSIPDKAPEIAGDKMLSFNNTHDICTDHISETGLEKETDCAPAPEYTAETAANTTSLSAISPQRTTDTISIPEKGTKGYENASNLLREITHVPENASVVASSPKMFAEEKAQEPVAHQSDKNEVPCTKPPETNSSKLSPQNVVRLVHRCGLCNKEHRNTLILRHAFWHYRLERKCMFCQSVGYMRGPLCHFKKHIKQLKMLGGLAEDKKCESIPEVSGKPDPAVQATVPKKARPGLAQIRSSLLMRLNFKRKTAPHMADTTDTDIRTLKQSLTKKSVSVQNPGEEEENNEESVQKNKVRYFTRGLVRKSESKGRFLRNRLSRRAKTRTLKADRDVSVPKDNPVHTLNGVIRKKRSLKHVQAERNHVTDKNVQVTAKQENKEQKADNVGTDEKAESKVKCDGNAKRMKTQSTNAEEKSLNSSEAKVKSLQRPGINKKKNTWAVENKDAEPVKKRKLDPGINEQKQDERNTTTETKPADELKSVEASVSNTTKQENGTGKRSKETSQQLQKNKIRATPSVVTCPKETCTFNAKPGPVLSHVLIHHPDDTKALEFFYNLAKQKCLFCGRRIWTPQHFFDHVVSHRGNLKLPCSHADCKKRFKTRLELGDHMLKDHQPLRAVCCFPGCTAQVSNLKLLYSHEREHYHVVRKKAVCKRDKSVASKVLSGVKDDAETSPTAANPKNTLVETQQMPESMETATAQTQSGKGSGQESNAAAAKEEDEISLTLNRGSVNYTRLVNGHSDYEREAPIRISASGLKEQESDFGKMSTKPFVRPPPSAYLDELYISMPKRWKGSQVSPKGYHSTEVSPVKRQVCPRCSASFGGEDEMQEHREKCTSLFGFDSDDESMRF